jgi:hypothetical protein
VYKTHTLSTFIHKVLLRSDWGLIFISSNILIYIHPMKKFVLALFFVVAAPLIFGYTYPENYKAENTTPPLLVLKGSLQDFQSLLNDLDDSNIPHDRVKAYQAWIVGQLEPQLKDSTKTKK